VALFDRFKKALSGQVEHAREMRAHPGPPDLGSLPVGTGAVGGLGALAPEVVGAYAGLDVAAIHPLDRLGPESAGLIGNAIRSRLRERGVGAEGLEPGELIAGQNAARIERMRAKGIDEAQIAAMQAHIAGVMAVHQATGWTVELLNGNRASVQIFDLGSTDSGFDGLKSTFTSQHTRSGVEEMQENLFEFAVDRLDDSPYETYYLPGHASARGRAHDAEAKAPHLGTMQLDRTLVALAALALFSLEG
jgi:hypothetical protein